MRIRAQHSLKGTRGILLIECLVYIAILGMIFSLAVSCFFRCLGYSRDLRRNADDVARVLKAGERWRADIRQAVTVATVRNAEGESLLLKGPAGDIRYQLADGKVWREAGGPDRRLVFLTGVKASAMERDQRSQVAAMRWEVELESRQSATRVRPLFTFTAVQDNEVKP